MGILKITEQLNKMKKLLFISIFLAFVASINAQTITAGMNGAQLRAAINNKVIALSDSLATVADSIIAHTSSIQLRLLKSDTASMLVNYTRNGELNSALAAKVNVSDTAAMLSHYALKSELGDAGIAIGDVRDEIADSLNVLRPLYVAAADTAAMLNPYAKLTDLSEGGIGIGAVQEEIADSLNVLRAAVTVGNGTKAPYFDGSQDGGQILYFYGDNGFYTALQGGAPVANRSYRLPIAALPSTGTTSLMNIDEYGNMGFVASTTYAPPANPTFTGIQKVSTTDTLSTKAYARSVGGGDVSALETRIDSIVDVLADTANLETVLQVDLDTDTLATKAYARLVGGGGGGVVGITLNSGTITLNGSEGTADDITFYTNGNGSYDLPAGGGNLTIMSQVQGWINDSLDNAKVDIRKFDSDTIPLFVFGLGSGHSADTALFNNGRLAGAFYNSGSDTLYVTELRGVLVEGTGTETIDVQVSWHTNMKDVSAINLNTTALTISNMTTGTSDASFNNNGIPPGRWVWCVLSGASSGNKPTALMLTMTGYRRNRSY